MYSIKKISENIAENLRGELKLDQEKYEVIEYGLHAFFHMVLSILFVVVFGAISGVLLESLVISFTIAILRRSSGGAHASTELTCAIIGAVVSVIPAIILVNANIKLNYIMIITFFVFLLSAYLIYKLAPVDSTNKPIKSEKKIKVLKKGSLITLGIYMVLVIIEILLSTKMDSIKLKEYVLCILFGVLWQSFTLTKLGHIVLNLMDSFFMKILGDKGGN